MIERTVHLNSLHLGLCCADPFLARGLARVSFVSKVVPLSHLMTT